MLIDYILFVVACDLLVVGFAYLFSVIGEGVEKNNDVSSSDGDSLAVSEDQKNCEKTVYSSEDVTRVGLGHAEQGPRRG